MQLQDALEEAATFVVPTLAAPRADLRCGGAFLVRLDMSSPSSSASSCDAAVKRTLTAAPGTVKWWGWGMGLEFWLMVALINPLGIGGLTNPTQGLIILKAAATAVELSDTRWSDDLSTGCSRITKKT